MVLVHSDSNATSDIEDVSLCRMWLPNNGHQELPTRNCPPRTAHRRLVESWRLRLSDGPGHSRVPQMHEPTGRRTASENFCEECWRRTKTAKFISLKVRNQLKNVYKVFNTMMDVLGDPICSTGSIVGTVLSCSFSIIILLLEIKQNISGYWSQG